MEAVKNYLDSTYLKTAEQLGISEAENSNIVKGFINEAILYRFKLIMIRPEYVSLSRTLIDAAHSKVLVGTVVDFPLGFAKTDDKLHEAQRAIDDGVDEVDFVINYQAFKKGEISLVKKEVLLGSKLCLSNNKSVKWIIETAALTEKEIIQISALIKNVVISNFSEKEYAKVFVKSSTGFYQTAPGLPNGATREAIIMMIENASPLAVKASGGIRNYEEALAMIRLGVQRIGTSAAKAIVNQQDGASDDY